MARSWQAFAPDDAHRHLMAVAKPRLPALYDIVCRQDPILPPDPGQVDLSHFLAKAVVGQQISEKAASSIWARLASAGEQNGGLRQFVATSDDQALRGLGLSRAKVLAVKGIFAADIDHLGTRDGLAEHVSTPAAETLQETLVSLRGIGPWTAEMALLFYFQHPDIWSVGDVALTNGMKRLAGKPRMTWKGAERLARHFRPYRSALSLWLWRIQDLGMLKDP